MPQTAGATPRASSPLRAGRRWRALVAAVLVGGTCTALLAGALWRASVRRSEREGFRNAATDVLDTAELLLSKDVAFVNALRVGLTHDPTVSPSSFARWFWELEGENREPGGLGTVVVRAVSNRELKAFLRRRNTNPAFRRLVAGEILAVEPSPSGHTCLIDAGVNSAPYTGIAAAVIQSDWCDPHSAMGAYRSGGAPQAQQMREAADGGEYLVHPVTAEGRSTLFVESAFYRAGLPLRTVVERRRALAGWVSSSFSIPLLLSNALEPYRGLSLALYHRNRQGSLERVAYGESGHVQHRFSESIALQLAGDWRIEVTGAGPGTALSANAQGAIVLGAGLLLTAMLAALLQTLVRSRARALGLVDEKTGELRHQALHDGLTGLANRVLALDRTEHMLARARREQVPVAALYVDLDGFKQVNDTFGHAAGDELLRIVAERLRSVVREGDTAARLGGDEFVVLVEGASLSVGPELVAERLLEVLREPYELGDRVGRELTLSASIGVAWGLRESADELLRDADLAMYEAKTAGRNRFATFQSTMQTAARDKVELAMDLAHALEREELFLLYQPTVDLASERITGVEALIRWRHPRRGLISPERFIPLAEESGLVVSIGAWVLREACLQAAAWHRRGHPLGMSVNVSARQLDSGSLMQEVRAALEQSSLEARSLTLEVTETALMRDCDATAKRLVELKRLGVRIAIDDFGTGYSSLAYLRQFPADALKIDRSFVAGIAESRHSVAIVHTLVRLGKALGIETLAEGIEDRGQLLALQREACDLGQGFLFSRPVPASAIEEFLPPSSSPASSDERPLTGADAQS